MVFQLDLVSTDKHKMAKTGDREQIWRDGHEPEDDS